MGFSKLGFIHYDGSQLMVNEKLLKQLKKELKTLNVIRKVSLLASSKKDSLNDDSFSYLIGAISSHKRIEELDLGNNNITMLGVENLLQTLEEKESFHLKKINIADCDIYMIDRGQIILCPTILKLIDYAKTVGITITV